MSGLHNDAQPLVMHIDLNSCFATVEQQARPMLRGRPVAIANRRTEHTSIVTASYEARALGVTLGMRVKDATRLVPDLVVLESDPPKYRYVYRKLMAIMNDYSAHVRMKSIDEGVIDFSESTEALQSRNLVDIGHEIKQRIRSEIGVAMRCNIGISTNRFLAKTAASLYKPDGLDVITHHNIRSVLGQLRLTDLTGIAMQNERRLNTVGIFTPLEFLDADETTLSKIVFKSVNGQYWYKRLRGWEVDKRDFDLKTAGRQYVLESRHLTRAQISQRLYHLCESVGAKIRSQQRHARGVLVYVRSGTHGYWQARAVQTLPFFSNEAIYRYAAHLFRDAPDDIREIGISCYELVAVRDYQMGLFGDQLAREQQLVDAVDVINGRYGERTIHVAETLGTGMYVKHKIPFGSTRYL